MRVAARSQEPRDRFPLDSASMDMPPSRSARILTVFALVIEASARGNRKGASDEGCSLGFSFLRGENPPSDPRMRYRSLARKLGACLCKIP